MTTIHAPVPFVAGDDWEIRATLIDENGAPYDLSSSPEIRWALVNCAQMLMLDEDDCVITVTDALAGKCVIRVPAEKTSPLPGGQYEDAIRIVIGGIVSTLARGPIYLEADPWLTATATMQLRRVS